MSLQVWLPLNGDLNNQGLSDVNIEQVSAPSYTVGKIGQALSGGKIKIPANQVNQIFNNINMSIAFWYNNNTTNTTGSHAICGFSGNGEGDSGATRIWDFFNYNTPNDFHWSMGNLGNGVLTGIFPANTWVHICVTWNSGTLKIYINGVLQTTQTGKSSNYTFDKSFYISFGLTPQLLNDFRIYDHTLSAKEVKEIAKGLVLHYKLDGKDEATTNLQSNGRMSTGSCYNGATQKYGFGTNTDIYYEDGNFQGRDCVKFKMGTAGQAAHPFTNIAYSPAVNSYKTISFDYYPTILDKLVFYSYNNNSPCTWSYNVDGIKASSSTATTNIIVPVKINKWNHVELTLYNTGTVADGWNYFQIGSGNHTSTTTDYWLFSNVQIENKDHATPFTLGTRTYTTEYDCSGYGHNGAPIDTTLVGKNDSSRYNNSLYFNGTTSGIIINDLNIGNIINTAVTYSFWIKPDGENGARSVYFGSYSGTSWSIEKTAGNVLRSYWNGSPDETCSGATITDGAWQHVCITKNGTSDIKVYINGVQKWTSTTTHSNLTFPTTFRIGRDTRASDGTPYKGQMSDFRIYATALSADDIKELYQTAASIDNKGNVYAYELEEV